MSMNIPTRVVFENKHIIVVHKPPTEVGFHVSEQHKGYFQTIKEDLVGEKGRLYPVHRLDSMTSGLLVLGKSQASAQELGKAFQLHRVHKYYISISDRKPVKKQGTIRGDMAKSRRGSYKLLRSMENPAVTKFMSFSLTTHGPNYRETNQDMHTNKGRMFIIKPETGKTHQVRVAMKAIGSPVAGDGRYDATASASLQDRGYLHCAALRFCLQDDIIQLICPPEDGSRFQDPSFVELFQQWFPKEQDTGVWFSGTPIASPSFQ